MNTPIVILGAGYTGQFLMTALSATSRCFLATSRTPQHHLHHVPQGQRLHFDLAHPATWSRLPAQAALLWCFPAAPLELVQQFAISANLSAHRLVVLGSTSAYDVAESNEYPPPWTDETAAIDPSTPRVQGEEFLRKECGAIVLRVAGMYGPGRNPIDWIKNGRVGPSRKYVNLIHVEDLAAVCLAALERGSPGEVYNVSDGRPRTWDEICRFAKDRFDVDSTIPRQDREPGKRISIDKLRSQLAPTPFRELETALAHL